VNKRLSDRLEHMEQGCTQDSFSLQSLLKAPLMC